MDSSGALKLAAAIRRLPYLRSLSMSGWLVCSACVCHYLCSLLTQLVFVTAGFPVSYGCFLYLEPVLEGARRLRRAIIGSEQPATRKRLQMFQTELETRNARSRAYEIPYSRCWTEPPPLLSYSPSSIGRTGAMAAAASSVGCRVRSS